MTRSRPFIPSANYLQVDISGSEMLSEELFSIIAPLLSGEGWSVNIPARTASPPNGEGMSISFSDTTASDGTNIKIWSDKFQSRAPCARFTNGPVDIFYGSHHLLIFCQKDATGLTDSHWLGCLGVDKFPAPGYSWIVSGCREQGSVTNYTSDFARFFGTNPSWVPTAANVFGRIAIPRIRNLFSPRILTITGDVPGFQCWALDITSQYVIGRMVNFLSTANMMIRTYRALNPYGTTRFPISNTEYGLFMSLPACQSLTTSVTSSGAELLIRIGDESIT